MTVLPGISTSSSRVLASQKGTIAKKSAASQVVIIQSGWKKGDVVRKLEPLSPESKDFLQRQVSSQELMQKFLDDCAEKQRERKRMLKRSQQDVQHEICEDGEEDGGEGEDHENDGIMESVQKDCQGSLVDYFRHAWKGLSEEKSLKRIEYEFKSCCELARVHPNLDLRLQATAFVLNVCLHRRTHELVQKLDELSTTLFPLCRTGEITKLSDPIFRWPYASIRRAALLSLGTMLQFHDDQDYFRRWLVKSGVWICVAQCIVQPTRTASRLLSAHYKLIDSESRRLSQQILAQEASHEELERSVRIARAHGLRDVECCLSRELEKRKSQKARLRNLRENTKVCNIIAMDASIDLGERLTALRIEKSQRQRLLALGQETRIHLKGFVSHVAEYEQAFAVPQVTDDHIQLQQDRVPTDEESVWLENLSSFEENEVKAATAAKIDKPEKKPVRSAERDTPDDSSTGTKHLTSREDLPDVVEPEVLVVLSNVIQRIEATSCVQDILRQVMENEVSRGIDLFEHMQALLRREREESAMMLAEDNLAMGVREKLRRELEVNRQGMALEDKEGVRKALKRLTKAERRTYILQEEEYLRKCRMREKKQVVDPGLEANRQGMLAEDRLARKIRKMDRQAQLAQQQEQELQQNQEYHHNDPYAATEVLEASYDEPQDPSNGWGQDYENESYYYYDPSNGWDQNHENYYDPSNGYDYYQNYDANTATQYFDGTYYDHYQQQQQQPYHGDWSENSYHPDMSHYEQ